jgi:hypothetical protein
MRILDKLIALVEALRLQPHEFERMPLAERERLAHLCQYIADQARMAPRHPTVGVLADVRRNGVHAE